MEGQFGRGVKKWVKPSASIGTHGYEYNKKLNKVIPNDENPIQMVNKEWSQRVDNNEEYSFSDTDSESEEEGFAIEFGELDLDNIKRRSNLGDDSGSLGTLGMAKAVGFKNMEEEESISSSTGEEDRPTKVTPNKGSSKELVSNDMDLLKLVKGNEEIMKLVSQTLKNNHTVSSKQDGDGSVT